MDLTGIDSRGTVVPFSSKDEDPSTGRKLGSSGGDAVLSLHRRYPYPYPYNYPYTYPYTYGSKVSADFFFGFRLLRFLASVLGLAVI